MSPELLEMVREFKALTARRKRGEALTDEENQRRRWLKSHLRNALHGNEASGPQNLASQAPTPAVSPSAPQTTRPAADQSVPNPQDLVADTMQTPALQSPPPDMIAPPTPQAATAAQTSAPRQPQVATQPPVAAHAHAATQQIPAPRPQVATQPPVAAHAHAATQQIPAPQPQVATQPPVAAHAHAATQQIPAPRPQVATQPPVAAHAPAAAQPQVAASRAQVAPQPQMAQQAQQPPPPAEGAPPKKGYTPAAHNMYLEQYYSDYLEDGYVYVDAREADSLQTVDPREMALYRAGLLGDESAQNMTQAVPPGLVFLDDFIILYRNGILPAPSDETEPDSDDPNLLIPGKRKVTVHLLAGTVKRGTIRRLARGELGFTLEPIGQGKVEELSFSQVKALFIHAGNGAPPAAEGRSLTVTFQDRRSVQGTSDDYVPGNPVFSLSPPPGRGQFERIVVNAAACASVR